MAVGMLKQRLSKPGEPGPTFIPDGQVHFTIVHSVPMTQKDAEFAGSMYAKFGENEINKRGFYSVMSDGQRSFCKAAPGTVGYKVDVYNVDPESQWKWK